jgi:hypothetical protein
MYHDLIYVNEARRDRLATISPYIRHKKIRSMIRVHCLALPKIVICDYEMHSLVRHGLRWCV